jgi:thiol-disulfide isomerase/thioredoxin
MSRAIWTSTRRTRSRSSRSGRAASTPGSGWLSRLWFSPGWRCAGGTGRRVLTAASLAGLLVWQAILHAHPRRTCTLPEARFAALDGAPQTLQGEGSGPVVVNLWATWCPPCRRELPMMMELAEATPAVRVVFLNQGEFGPHVQQYLLREGLSSDRVLLDPETEALAHFDAPGLPATLFFSSDGVLEDLHLGEISRAAFRSRLQSLR